METVSSLSEIQNHLARFPTIHTTWWLESAHKRRNSSSIGRILLAIIISRSQAPSHTLDLFAPLVAVGGRMIHSAHMEGIVVRKVCMKETAIIFRIIYSMAIFSKSPIIFNYWYHKFS